MILTALRWFLSDPLSAQQVMELLAERGIDVSRRSILRWAPAFGPLLAQAILGGAASLGGGGSSMKSLRGSAAGSRTSIA